MRPRDWVECLTLVLAAVGCAGAPARSPTPAGASPAPKEMAVALDDAAEQAARRLEELKRRQIGAGGPAPAAAAIRQRYETVLERPGTPEERKPEILLRLAELAYREEEGALREAYEAGDEPAVPRGRRYTGSIERYRRLAEEYPDTPQALTAFYNLGYLYAEDGDALQSAWAYGEVLRRDPDTAYADEIHMRLGEAAFDAGELEGAILHYRAVVEGGKPEYVDKAFHKLGWCYYNLDRYDGAILAFSQVLARGEASPEDLRLETLEVMARSFVEWGGVDAVESYLAERPEGRKYGDRLYRNLGDLYRDSSRYREAVRAYAAGVDAYPASVLCLDAERGILLALIALRDHQGANERRESWARRYGPESEWHRAHGRGPTGVERDGLVEEGLRLAAGYHHGRAQRGQGNLEHAVALYERYLDWFGSDSEKGYEMAYAYAQALKEAGRLAEAAEQYRAVANHPGLDLHREDASYRTVEVLRALYERDPAVLDELAEAHEEYAVLNPGSALVPEVLFAEGELLFEAERFAAAREVFARVARDHAAHDLAPQARERIARCYFRQEDFEQAEQAARRALGENLDPATASRAKKLLVFSIFKQGEQGEAAGDREGANRHFFRLAEEFPRDETAPIALHRAAENLQTLGREEEGAGVYERLARRYPNSEYARSALVLSAQIFASMGDWNRLARSYEDLYRLQPRKPGASDTLLRAARALERAGEQERAARLFAEFAAQFPEDPRIAEARFREGESLWALGRADEAADRYRAAWESRVPEEEEASVYRAKAALALGKMSLTAFRGVELTGDLEQALSHKETLLEEALEHLVRAASLPYAEPLTEALYRAGEAFEDMKEALLASERPQDLTEEEREEYDFLLEEKAFPLEERAVGYYRKGVAAALKAGVHTTWVERMFERLEALLPWAYQRPEEPALAWDIPRLALPAGEKAEL